MTNKKSLPTQDEVIQWMMKLDPKISNEELNAVKDLLSCLRDRVKENGLKIKSFYGPFVSITSFVVFRLYLLYFHFTVYTAFPNI